MINTPGYVVYATHKGSTISGQLTGTGAGKYTGLLLKNGETVAVPKHTVRIVKEKS